MTLTPEQQERLKEIREEAYRPRVRRSPFWYEIDFLLSLIDSQVESEIQEIKNCDKCDLCEDHV